MATINDVKTALVLAPHTDDGELGCGATISKLIREQVAVWYVAFSKCEESLPIGCPKDTLVNELRLATEKLGISQERVSVLDYKVRHFSESRQKILDDLIKLGGEIKPDVVFIPSPHDIHQDHATIASEGMRAFKKTSIFAYELPWNNYSFFNQAFVRVSEEDVHNKILALQQYKSQNNRQYVKPDSILAILRTHGMQVGSDYAEVFEVPRIVV